MSKESLKTAVLGASPNPHRYSHLAVERLVEHGHEPVPIGLRPGNIAGVDILLGKPEVEDVHTLTLYVGEKNLEGWIDYILSLNPQRIIINPGAENAKFEAQAKAQGVEVLRACTLVMLSTGLY